MKCHVIELPKSELSKLPKDELAFLTVILNLANEINILRKAAIASKPGAKLQDPIVDSAHNCQLFFFLKLLAGKLYEGWRTIETGYFGAKISKKYEALLPPMSKEALGRLKIYFGNPKNILKDVRQKYAFHTDLERITESLNSLSNSETCKIVVTENIGNNYAQFAGLVANSSVLDSVEAKTMNEAIEILMKETLLPIPQDFLNFADGFAQAALTQCEFSSTEHELSGATPMSMAHLPYFAENE